MRLLLDSCVPSRTADTLRQWNHDVVWIGDRHPDPGDEAILDEAFLESRVLITLDKDFGELAIVFGRPHRGILRLINFRASQLAAVIQTVLESHPSDLEASAILTAEPGRIRIRPADLP